jgi:hypothetical protein
MEIKYGALVIDKNGNVVGSVDRLMRNAWSGETTKFMVLRKAEDSDLFLTPEDVLEATDTEVRLGIAVE